MKKIRSSLKVIGVVLLLFVFFSARFLYVVHNQKPITKTTIKGFSKEINSQDGILVKEFVKLNDTVKKGDVLAQFDTEILELELVKVQLQLKRQTDETHYRKKQVEQTLEDYIYLKKEQSKTKELSQEIEKLLSLLEEKQIELSLYENQKEIIKTEKMILEKRIERRTLYSPCDGFIVHKHAFVGENLSTSQTLYTISDIENVWLEIDVLGKKAPHLQLSDTLQVLISDYPDLDFVAEVQSIGKLDFDNSKSLKLLIKQLKKNTSEKTAILEPGMDVTIKI